MASEPDREWQKISRFRLHKESVKVEMWRQMYLVQPEPCSFSEALYAYFDFINTDGGLGCLKSKSFSSLIPLQSVLEPPLQPFKYLLLNGPGTESTIVKACGARDGSW